MLFSVVLRAGPGSGPEPGPCGPPSHAATFPLNPNRIDRVMSEWHSLRFGQKGL
jgi:hypothetical protein